MGLPKPAKIISSGSLGNVGIWHLAFVRGSEAAAAVFGGFFQQEHVLPNVSSIIHYFTSTILLWDGMFNQNYYYCAM